MALALRSLHDLPSPTGAIDRRYPLGDAPVVSPSTLGINLTAFNVAAFNLQGLTANTNYDFNYRQFLTGTSAATAAITVNSASSTLGNWVVDASGNGISIATGALANSGSLFVSASNGTTTVSFPVQQWSSLAVAAAGVMKLVVGNGFWFDNQFWYTTSGGVGAEQAGFNAIIGSMKLDPLLKYVYVSFTWGCAEGPTRGDYTKIRTACDSILATLSSANHKIGLIVEFWQESLQGSTPNLAYYPQYVLDNSWVIGGVQAGTNRTQPKWDIDDLWSAYNDLMVYTCDRYNNHPLFFGVTSMDESHTADIADNKTRWCDPVHYNAKYLEQQLLMKSHLSKTPLYVPFNYLPPGDVTEAPTMANMIKTLEAAYPKQCIYGGPDPFKRQTTFQKLISGTIAGLGDLRKQVLIMQRTQETYLGNKFVTVANPDGTTKSVAQDPGVTPLQLYDQGVANNAVMMTWNYENWLFYKYADQLNAIHARNGAVGTPPAGGSYQII